MHFPLTSKVFYPLYPIAARNGRQDRQLPKIIWLREMYSKSTLMWWISSFFATCIKRSFPILSDSLLEGRRFCHLRGQVGLLNCKREKMGKDLDLHGMKWKSGKEMKIFRSSIASLCPPLCPPHCVKCSLRSWVGADRRRAIMDQGWGWTNLERSTRNLNHILHRPAGRGPAEARPRPPPMEKVGQAKYHWFFFLTINLHWRQKWRPLE